MRVTLTIDPADRRTEAIRHDVTTFLTHIARDQWHTSEDVDLDGVTDLTADFRDPLDAADFQRWREVARHVRRT